MAEAPSIAQVAEGVGVLMNLDPIRASQALDFLRKLSEPGMMYIGGELVYSAQFLGDTNQLAIDQEGQL